MGLSRERTQESQASTIDNLAIAKFVKETVENAACDGIGSNFSGAAFCLAQLFGGLLVYQYFSGTEKQPVANDYAKRIAFGSAQCEVSAMSCL